MTGVSPREYKEVAFWALSVMLSHGFKGETIRQYKSEAARGRSCPRCLVPAGTLCINLRKESAGQQTKWPHAERVHYEMLAHMLKVRGYR